MEYGELRDQVNGMDERRRRQYAQVLSLAAIGGDVRPDLRGHLAAASSCEEFFEALYRDDELRFTRAWAAWARLRHRDWIDRFDPVRTVGSVAFGGRGLPVEFEGGALLVPTGGHGKTTRVYVFEDGAFNEDAATYFTSLEGSFTCAQLEFDGVYDVFTAGGSVVFERWALNEKGLRTKAAELAQEYRLTG